MRRGVRASNCFLYSMIAPYLPDHALILINGDSTFPDRFYRIALVSTLQAGVRQHLHTAGLCPLSPNPSCWSLNELSKRQAFTLLSKYYEFSELPGQRLWGSPWIKERILFLLFIFRFSLF